MQQLIQYFGNYETSNAFLAKYGKETSLGLMVKANSRFKKSALRVCLISNRGFTSAIKLREISIYPRDGFGPTCVSSKSNHECNSESTCLLKESFVSLSEKPGLDLSIA